MRNKILDRTRLQLAGCYSAVMALLLGLSGLVSYQVLVRAYLYSVDQELQGIAKAFHKNLEQSLTEPAKIPQRLEGIFPDLCLANRPCPQLNDSVDRSENALDQKIASVYQSNYYLRFVSRSDQLVATSGLRSEGLPETPGKIEWQTLQNQEGERFHQISLPLHTIDRKVWGYLQVGRSLREVDRRLAALQNMLLIGLPISVVLVGLSSWWLSGLAMRPVQQSYQQMQQFTADAAHELRTPITAILATIDSVLRMPTISETESREAFTTAERQVSRFLGMVKDLLLLSRLEQHTLTFQPQTLCLNDLMFDLIDEFTALAEVSNLALSEQIQTNKPLEIVADEDQIYRLLSNLVINAIRYTPSGKVTLKLYQERDQAVIQVQDTGIGIAAEDLLHVFDRFYRVDSDRSRNSGGTGLGLAIAKAIVETHDGSIQVQSRIGSGSTFIVRLPLKSSRPLPIKLNLV
ncbi:MAG: two-component sensor histidine kinase [Leptolyngbya sp. UWPOB_LEPTO1]|uniref:two-component system sensor histidine kinase RppB n=1 Tax=Leptolyngbya sp. UWPOB_LEPTO1 TaxID=2815653 RepID=UPI001AD3BCA5|nr:two-component system sensor histidine kinase RppB [Leptolyngbya sp. UWPOB_LEPTO1]MBN8560210.1 two-component sensor histidine kinase [Leptolyngbya sp. UWPOB_LEPTO1]